jgi:hypothetical protein
MSLIPFGLDAFYDTRTRGRGGFFEVSKFRGV